MARWFRCYRFERTHQVSRVVVPCLRVLLQTTVHDLLKARWVCIERARWRRFGLEHTDERRHRVVADERMPSRGELVPRYAEGEKVGSKVRVRPPELLGSHIPGGAMMAPGWVSRVSDMPTPTGGCRN